MPERTTSSGRRKGGRRQRPTVTPGGVTKYPHGEAYLCRLGVRMSLSG